MLRERETGTVQFAWTQLVTRWRWLSAKTGWLLLAGAVSGGAVAGLVTWWYAPLNALHQNQFQPGYFDLQGIVPIGYAVFAVALGIAAGTGRSASASRPGYGCPLPEPEASDPAGKWLLPSRNARPSWVIRCV